MLIRLGLAIDGRNLTSEVELFRGHAALNMEDPGIGSRVRIVDSLIERVVEEKSSFFSWSIVAILVNVIL